ncbi:MAG: HAD-IA family hydrolase [Anaeromyxobacteraceae bacterium]
MPSARLLTFDVFGTVIDWRRGLREALAAQDVSLDDAAFDRVVDRQGELEQEVPFRKYREITRLSLQDVLGLDAAKADAVGAEVGAWPTYPESAAALRRMMTVAPCVATTNSDRAHGEQAQERLGFRLSGWICAEDVGCYKPDPKVWREAAARLGAELGPAWWHVSAYADYDLAVANALGLTTVYVARPHARPGAATLRVNDLAELATRVAGP